MQEFICPNGRMSINGACPIFEGGDGQIRDYQTPKTFDQKYNEIEDIEKQREKSGFFKFDFEKPTENFFEKADNIISKNIGAYDSFVEEKLGIPSKAQNFLRVGSAIATGSLMPFAIPFFAGAAFNRAEQQAVQQQNFVDAAAAKRNIQQYTSGGGEGNQSSPATTSQGVTSAQHAAFRS